MPEQTQTLQERLVQAQHEANGWAEKLNDAEHKLQSALNERDYAAADKHKAAADSAREQHLMAAATVQGLQAGAQAIADHQQAENLARQQRERREQCTHMHNAAREREAEALDDVQRFMAEVPVAYRALAAAMQAAIEAEQRVSLARFDAHEAGIGAELIPHGMPRPPRANMASAKYEANPILVQILRSPRLD